MGVKKLRAIVRQELLICEAQLRMFPPEPPAVSGVPSAPLPAIWLFLNECSVPPPFETPVPFPAIVFPPRRRVAAAPAVAAPAPFELILLSVTVLTIEGPALETATPFPVSA